MPYYEQLIYNWSLDPSGTQQFMDDRADQIRDAVWAEGPDEEMNKAMELLGEEYFA